MACGRGSPTAGVSLDPAMREAVHPQTFITQAKHPLFCVSWRVGFLTQITSCLNSKDFLPPHAVCGRCV